MVAFDKAALTALLTEQRYEDVAPQLDEDELKVCMIVSSPFSSHNRSAALRA